MARDLGEAFVFLNDVKCAMEVDRRVHAEARARPAPRSRPRWPGGSATRSTRGKRFIDDYLRITRRCRRAMERAFAEALD